MRFWKTSVFIFFAALGCGMAQVSDSSYFGAYFSYNFNSHKSDFRKLPAIPNCCPRFTEGEGRGYSVGLFYEYALPMKLSLSLRGGFNNLAGVFTEYEQTKVKIDNQVADGEFKHYINTKIADISLEPVLNYRVFAGLSLHIGLHLGVIVQKDFAQYEEITQPANRGVFTDTETRRRNTYSGQIDSVATVFTGFLAGVSYRLPLTSSGSLWLVPEVFYLFGESDILEDYEWKANALKLGLSLKYTDVSVPRKVENRQNYRVDTVRLETDRPETAGFHNGRTRTKDTTEEFDDLIVHITNITRTDTVYTLKPVVVPKPKPVLKITTDREEIALKQDYATFYCSILPSVFFGLNSSSLPADYSTFRSYSDYHPQYEPDEPVTIQKDILNIIGSRLRDNRAMKVSLKGYTDKTTEGRNFELAVGRAQTIKKYLVDTWGIEPDRIKVIDKSYDCNPKLMTASQNEMGYADNRRVEILTEDMQLYQPVIVMTPIDSPNPNDETLTVTPQYNMPDSVDAWEVLVKNGSRTIFSDKGQRMPSSFTIDVNKIGIKNKLNFSEPLAVEVFLREKDGSASYESKKIKLKNESAEIESKRIAYILFDVDKMILNEINESTLKTILNKIGSFKNLKITGFTDILGEYGRNKNLSLSRAQTINRVILRLKPEGLNIAIENAASDYFPFGIKSYDTQIERFLSRSVIVELY